MYYRIYQVWEKYGEKFIKYPCIYHPNDKILSYLFQISQSIHLIDIIIYYIYVFNLSEKATAPHSSTLAWKIPWMEEPGRLQSMGSLRVGHDWATSLSCIWEGNGNPLQCSCLENPRDRGAWWAAVYGVTLSWTRLKWLSSSRDSTAH